MWHDARDWLPPCCGEYRWEMWADELIHEKPAAERTLRERIFVGLLRHFGARY